MNYSINDYSNIKSSTLPIRSNYLNLEIPNFDPRSKKLERKSAKKEKFSRRLRHAEYKAQLAGKVGRGASARPVALI